MPQYMISKHSGQMKQCGIDIQLISKVMKILTILQQISMNLMKQILQASGSSTDHRSHYMNTRYQHLINLKSNIELEVQPAYQISQKTITSPTGLTQEEITVQNNQTISLITSPKSTELIEQNQQLFERIDYLIQIIHHEYVQYHNNIVTLTYLFAKYRFLDICGKFGANTRTWQRLNQKKPYLNNTKNLFLKSYFLQDYLKNVKIYFTDIVQCYPIANYYLINPNPELQVIQGQVSNLKTEIQLDYSQKNKISASRAVRQLRNLVQITSIKSIGSPFLLGFWLATVTIIIIAIIFIIVYFKINFTTNTDFQKTFPIWRGLFYFIYLIWIMGINTYIFNYFKINFNLLTAFNNYHLPNPSRLLVCAAIFTSIHFLLFLGYLIKLAQIGNTFTIVPEEYLPGISWLIFLLFFIFPIRRFYFRQRLYPFMMFFRSIASPFIGVQFKFSIFIQIFVSFRQPLRDMVYTFTYYFIDNTVVYWDTIMYETIIGIVLYSFRIIQNLRMMYQNRLCGGMPIYSVAKSLLGFITMITSYLSKNQTSKNYYFLYIWLLTALASTSLAYYMDVWNDWGLLDKKFGYLRSKLIYRNKKMYYAIIFLNLILRFVWMLNVSPDVLRRLPMKPYIVVMIISSIQITRRGIWMIFRVQKEHISAQSSLSKLFTIENLTFKQMERPSSSQNQKQMIISSPNWLKIKINPQDKFKKAIIQNFIQKNLQKMRLLNQKLQEGQTIINSQSLKEQKYLVD